PCASSPIDPGECFAADKGKLQVTDSATAGKDKLSWQWNNGFFFDQSVLGTPMVATTYTMCIYDTLASVPTLKGAYTIPASPTLWIDKSPKGLQYKDPDGTGAG